MPIFLVVWCFSIVRINLNSCVNLNFSDRYHKLDNIFLRGTTSRLLHSSRLENDPGKINNGSLCLSYHLAKADIQSIDKIIIGFAKSPNSIGVDVCPGLAGKLQGSGVCYRQNNRNRQWIFAQNNMKQKKWTKE